MESLLVCTSVISRKCNGGQSPLDGPAIYVNDNFDESRSYPSGIQLRIGADLMPRIDIPAGVFDLTTAEMIHFRGGNGNMCPTN
jgi:hypothetical protein